MAEKWMSCSACRTDIEWGAQHWVCSVSTCNSGRTRLVFCSVPCWDSHVATMRHRDAWAVEARAPGLGEVTTPATARAVSERTPAAASAPAAPARKVTPPPAAALGDQEILVVVSKVKKYVKDRSGMNTSDAVATALSEHLRALCDQAIRAAAGDGRKTVLDRDVPRVKRD